MWVFFRRGKGGQEINLKWDWFQTLTTFILTAILPWPFLTNAKWDWLRGDFFCSVYTVRVTLTQTEPGLCSSTEPHNRSFERSGACSVEGHWLSVSVHAKRMQTNGGVNSHCSKTPDHKTQQGSSKTDRSSKVLGIPTESYRDTSPPHNRLGPQ